jgi:hypothetical protein
MSGMLDLSLWPNKRARIVDYVLSHILQTEKRSDFNIDVECLIRSR